MTPFQLPVVVFFVVLFFSDVPWRAETPGCRRAERWDFIKVSVFSALSTFVISN